MFYSRNVTLDACLAAIILLFYDILRYSIGVKKLSAEQIQNIIFTILVVVVAGVIYILSGLNAQKAREEAAAMMTTPDPTAAPSEEPRFSLVPESVFVSLITENDLFAARRDTSLAHAYELVCGTRRAGSVALSYTLSDGYVNSVTLTFLSPMKPWSKPRTEIERAYTLEYDALYVLLPACFSACDLDGALIDPILLRWYSDALAARDSGKTIEDVYAGARFAAYPSQRGGEDVVVCTLMPS